MENKENFEKASPGQFNLRKGRESINNTTYFVTFNTYDQKKILVNHEIYTLILEKITWLEKSSYAKVYCLIMMPDHVHIVFRLTGTKDLSALMHSIKSFLSNRINRLGYNSGKLWQSGFFDHRIRNNGRFMQIVYYCYTNPYNKKICSYDSLYEYWYCIKDIWYQMKKEMGYLRKLEEKGLGFYPSKLLSIKP